MRCDWLLMVMEAFFKIVGISVLVGAFVLAVPMMVEQACSDEGDGWSGATPDYPCHEEVWNSLPPTY